MIKKGISWWRNVAGEVCEVFRPSVDPPSTYFICVARLGVSSYLVNGNGKHPAAAGFSLVEELPDCTGFDWKPAPKVVPWTIRDGTGDC